MNQTSQVPLNFEIEFSDLIEKFNKEAQSVGKQHIKKSLKSRKLEF